MLVSWIRVSKACFFFHSCFLFREINWPPMNNSAIYRKEDLMKHLMQKFAVEKKRLRRKNPVAITLSSLTHVKDATHLSNSCKRCDSRAKSTWRTLDVQLKFKNSCKRCDSYAESTCRILDV